MTLITNHAHNLTTLRPRKMPPAIVSHQVVLGIAAFSVSFGLSLVPNWDFSKAFLSGVITVLATYSAAFLVDKRRRTDELKIVGSLQRRIRDLEALKSRIFREIEQLEEYKTLLHTETQQLQKQIGDCRNQRDSLHRDIGTFAAQKKQIESEVNNLQNEFSNLESSHIGLNNIYNNLIIEKRKLELNCHVFRAEIKQIQIQIDICKQEKKELENDLILLGRLKPQLEEKLYELRIEVQNQEMEISKQNDLLTQITTSKNNLENTINTLQAKTLEQQSEINQFQNQISLLQQERDLLQNQIWELIQLETTNSNWETLPDNQENNLELFPFDELLQPLDIDIIDTEHDQPTNLPTEWHNLLENLSAYEIQVLKAILEKDNLQETIKLAEANITMPHLLIDAINEIANKTIGKSIIETNTEIPEIIEEHLLNVKTIISKYS
ncbi:tellurite resistance TerB C-terminal domain-containing protein [Dolichospermum planctonicum CS-1226]|uniref:Tellurite resistance TerB C-terminal domain-containing protein n=1 Tax=Dolichospermum planctonicum CS-1226 TaxID=3021751 RepID=A0ABT5ABV8_9CYAN|nr:tellurite resistance TerB C-terminal domain-containing protein [Dolichospermum planctonicum]MDB9534769.1 tellurite resistance TerB C-terminal domain-containing protein [Dolichospermum planctonicum CS-1226]